MQPHTITVLMGLIFFGLYVAIYVANEGDFEVNAKW
jgi:hypothetical protein